jgi:hypothetical protein
MPPRRRSTKAAAPVVEDVIEDDEALEEDLDELDDEPAPAPKRRGRPAKSAPVAEKPAPRRTKAAAAEEKAESYGTTWLVEYVNEQLDTDFDPKALRVLLRKATEAGILDRDDNSRYSFSGPGDRQVARLLKFIRDSEKEAPAEKPAPKAKAAPARRAATATKTAPTRRRTRKAEPVEEDDPDMPDFDDEDVDEL